MDIQNQPVQPISDDQELAKVLAGITQQPADSTNLNFDDNPVPTNAAPIIPEKSMIKDEEEPAMPSEAPIPQPTPVVEPSQPAMVDNDLESIKKDALIELRPLVDKLNLEAEEKFNIYLLLLRSTDDKTLIAPAHKAAIEITDESKKAQALLDIIKEIDFLSNPL